MEIPFSHAIAKMRIDSEGFGKTEAQLLAMLSLTSCVQLIALAEVSDGNHLSIAEDFSLTSGVRYLRGQDISSDMMLDDKNAIFIPGNEYDKLTRSHIYKGDVLITIVGANTGQTALVYEAPSKLTANCKLGILRVRRESKIPPPYLHVFLASLFGQFQIQQSKRGAGQTGLILPDLKALLVPRFSAEFEQTVAATSQHAHQVKLDSKAILKKIEQILLRALGLGNWQPPEPLTYTRRASEAFATGRLDAEHFQPKYDALISALRAAEGTFKLQPLGELSEPLKYGCSTQLDYVEEGRIFLRIADLENKRFELGSVLRVPMATKFRESDLVKENDVLISRSGTLGIAVPITKEFSGAAYGSYFIRTRPERSTLHPEFLSLFINSYAGQLQVEGKNTGGVQTNLTIPAIESILVPVGPIEWQMQFVTQVNSANAARLKANTLLKAAKHAVEIAIENSEAAAMAYLKKMEAA